MQGAAAVAPADAADGASARSMNALAYLDARASGGDVPLSLYVPPVSMDTFVDAAQGGVYDPVMTTVSASRTHVLIRVVLFTVVYISSVIVPAVLLVPYYEQDDQILPRIWLAVCYVAYTVEWLCFVLFAVLSGMLARALTEQRATLLLQRLTSVNRFVRGVAISMLSWTMIGFFFSIRASGVLLGYGMQYMLGATLLNCLYALFLECFTHCLCLAWWCCRPFYAPDMRRRMGFQFVSRRPGAEHEQVRQPGVTYAAHQLPQRPVTSDASSAPAAAASVCSICLHDITDVITDLPCEHSFHTECIRQWLRQSNSCPCCRVVPRFDRQPAATAAAAAQPATAAGSDSPHTDQGGSSSSNAAPELTDVV